MKPFQFVSLRAARGILLGALLLVGLSSCVATARPARGRPQAAKVVVVKKGHAHTARCGHYRHDGRWYHLKGHVHKRGCGHAHVQGVWVRRG